MCGLKPGDEVITVSHSFIASANAIRQCGGVPVFVDIEENGFNIDPAAIEPAITGRTRALRRHAVTLSARVPSPGEHGSF